MRQIDHSVNHEAKIRGISEEGIFGRDSNLNYAGNFGVSNATCLSESFFHFGKPTRHRIVTASKFAEIIQVWTNHRLYIKPDTQFDLFRCDSSDNPLHIGRFALALISFYATVQVPFCTMFITTTKSSMIYSAKLISNQVDNFRFPSLALRAAKVFNRNVIKRNTYHETQIVPKPPLPSSDEPIYVSITRCMVCRSAVVICFSSSFSQNF